MNYKVIKNDLFKMDDSYQLAHCISSDANMGAGIAVDFKRNFKLGILNEMASKGQLQVGTCRRVDKILNLITKKKYWQKPSYESFTKALVSMKELCINEGITQIAMPKIGCGRDRLQWGKVEKIIKETFEDTNIEIVVCIQ